MDAVQNPIDDLHYYCGCCWKNSDYAIGDLNYYYCYGCCCHYYVGGDGADCGGGHSDYDTDCDVDGDDYGTSYREKF